MNSNDKKNSKNWQQRIYLAIAALPARKVLAKNANKPTDIENFILVYQES